MLDRDSLAEEFESNRPRLRSVAYRMLGSHADADDAVQEAWFRLTRSATDEVANLGGWLTTVVARVCLDMLRSRAARREDPLDVQVPDPVVDRPDALDPEQDAVLADSVGLALLVVLERLEPAERLALVLHDMFSVPFDTIAAIAGRSPAAVRQLAVRARRRVEGAPVPDGDLGTQRKAVDAFMAAARDGDFDGLVAVLDPDVVFRTDTGVATYSRIIRGAVDVARGAAQARNAGGVPWPAMVNGAPGVVLFDHERPIGVMAFTVVGGRIVEIDVLADPARIARLDLASLLLKPLRSRFDS
jgi:RNA polymerase sigma-70 factor (ECF subfamily)